MRLAYAQQVLSELDDRPCQKFREAHYIIILYYIILSSFNGDLEKTVYECTHRTRMIECGGLMFSCHVSITDGIRC